ncbi:hypothetical protein BpHYR1_005405 [Brachionus plicatilis]|uniref:Uncharacterized protein n=1 Tax=Brachionus plicatilis TaxID=10195 RepID=A0A3M7Q7D5_BRAPC|nr:hypothetical protein BpHYR1_005405 [Brachionus plicatilis]
MNLALLQQASKLDLRRRETIFRPFQSSKLTRLIKLYTDPNQIKDSNNFLNEIFILIKIIYSQINEI